MKDIHADFKILFEKWLTHVNLMFVYVRYADDLVLMANIETALHSVIERLTEIGRCYGREMSVTKKPKVMRI